MSDEKALLGAIWEHPHEDTPRLMYADWLQEHGQMARAEFIRVQCERARLDGWDDAERIEHLKARETELLNTHARSWMSALPRKLQNEPFRRGFVYPRLRRFVGEKFRKLAPAEFDAVPQWAVIIKSFERIFDRVFASPHLVRCDELNLHGGKYPHDVLEELADNDRLRNVSSLYTETPERRSTPAGVTAFFNGPAATSITTLRCWRLPAAGFTALAASRTAARLRNLEIVFNDLGPDCPTRFTAEAFPNLRALEVRGFHSDGPVTGEAIVRLITATPAVRLRKLDLQYAQVTDAGAEQLAAWPGLAHLRWLALDQELFGEAGFRALARSPYLNGLKHLAVGEYYLRDLPKVKAELDARFGSVIHYE